MLPLSKFSYLAHREFLVAKPNPIQANSGTPPKIPMRSQAPKPTVVPGITISNDSTGSSSEFNGPFPAVSSVSAQPSLSSSTSALSPSSSPSESKHSCGLVGNTSSASRHPSASKSPGDAYFGRMSILSL